MVHVTLLVYIESYRVDSMFRGTIEVQSWGLRASQLFTVYMYKPFLPDGQLHVSRGSDVYFEVNSFDPEELAEIVKQMRGDQQVILAMFVPVLITVIDHLVDVMKANENVRSITTKAVYHADVEEFGNIATACSGGLHE